MGCLSNGQSWDFHYLRRAKFDDINSFEKIDGYELFITDDIKATTQKEVRRVMGTNQKKLCLKFRYFVSLNRTWFPN
jgi:hypothetical protein